MATAIPSFYFDYCAKRNDVHNGLIGKPTRHRDQISCARLRGWHSPHTLISGKPNIAKLRNLNYGWIVVLAIALMLFGGAGARFSFGVFLKPVTEEFDWSRGSLAGAIAIAGLATGGLRPVAGMLADHHDPKIVAAVGVLIGGLALAAMSLVQELWQVYIIFIIMGIGFTLASPGAVAKIIGAWFTKRRALAMSVAGTGSAAGETALVPTAAIAVAYIGWREGYLILAAILLVLILPPVFLFLKSRPDPGQHADGADGGTTDDDEDLSKASADPNAGMSFDQACRTGIFWRLTIGFFI
ncbi:MAG: MFS transporter [Dehalococcoidia bacterium]|jgi:sugar phosphate permease|nr:MFS transporter [Dehalococcoidia bacterium]MDP7484850.1 MFS transporter [Dehalococcoidia bacterium]|tara:strand:+ start:11606 stop:12499 length:894 start_codon:yes stop_codon:yes gene_type:complete